MQVEGGHLAYAEDGDTNRFLREYMRKNKVRSAYLGLTDQQQVCLESLTDFIISLKENYSTKWSLTITSNWLFFLQTH